MKISKTTDLVRVEFEDPAEPDFHGAIVVTRAQFEGDVAAVDAQMQAQRDAFSAVRAPQAPEKVAAAKMAEFVAVDESITSLESRKATLAADLNIDLSAAVAVADAKLG